MNFSPLSSPRKDNVMLCCVLDEGWGMHQVPEERPRSPLAAAAVESLLIPAPPQCTAASQLRFARLRLLQVPSPLHLYYLWLKPYAIKVCTRRQLKTGVKFWLKKKQILNLCAWCNDKFPLLFLFFQGCISFLPMRWLPRFRCVFPAQQQTVQWLQLSKQVDFYIMNDNEIPWPFLWLDPTDTEQSLAIADWITPDLFVNFM